MPFRIDASRALVRLPSATPCSSVGVRFWASRVRNCASVMPLESAIWCTVCPFFWAARSWAGVIPKDLAISAGVIAKRLGAAVEEGLGVGDEAGDGGEILD